MKFFGMKKKSKSRDKEDKKKDSAAGAGKSSNEDGAATENINKMRGSHGSSNAQQSQSASSSDQQQPPPGTVVDVPAGDPAYAKPDVTRNLVKKFISDIWNRGELNLIPHVCASNIRFNGNTGLDKIGHDGFARMVATIHEALSDYHCEIHSMVVEDNKAFCRLRFSGKHTGELLGYPPTGQVVSWMGATEFTCLNGRILKVWELGDMKTLEEQLQRGIAFINTGGK